MRRRPRAGYRCRRIRAPEGDDILVNSPAAGASPVAQAYAALKGGRPGTFWPFAGLRTGEGRSLVAVLPICHPRRVRLGVVLMVLSLLLAAPAGAHTRGGYWPVAKVMRALDGERIRVGSKRLRVDSATSLCSGEGRAKRRGGVRMWAHFRCTFSTFTALGPGRDAEFRVHVLGPRGIGVSGARWIAG